jgi:hypothetical protein
LRFREPEAAITSRLGRLALLPNYQLDLGAPAPTASAEASMNRTNLDCFGVASMGSGGLIGRSGWDFRQPAELYFESLAGSRNPFPSGSR